MSATATDLAGVRSRVEAALATFLAAQRSRLSGIDPALDRIADAIEALVTGGKRLRPAFGYWGFRGAGGRDGDEVLAALATLELVQASALIHDDLMDASDTRRGEPSVHRRFEAYHRSSDWRGEPAGFGANVAILAGDLCLAWSDEMLHTCGIEPAALARVRPIFDGMRTELMVGQYLDILASASGDTSVDRASKIATYKSAKYTVERPLRIGAALAGAGPDIDAAYSTYGLAIGEAFQLRDDVLGVFGDPDETGKPAGDDIREGKRTYLVATALARIGPDDAATLRRDLGDPTLDAFRVDRFRAIIEGSGALAATERRIDRLTAEALSTLDAVPLANGAGDALRALATAAVQRRR